MAILCAIIKPITHGKRLHDDIRTTYTRGNHMNDAHTPRLNHLLDALPIDEYDRLTPHLELIKMPLGQVLYESGEQLHHVYFPTTSIISLLYVMENGASAEIASSAMKAFSAFRFSWAEKPPQAAPWFKVRVTAIDCRPG